MLAILFRLINTGEINKVPTEVSNAKDIKPGDIYEDSAYHPCICIGVDNDEVWGISLIDGTYPRTETIGLSGIRKLALAEAWEWKLKGPQDTDIDSDTIKKWW